MSNEPEIVRLLREEERLGILLSNEQNYNEDLEKQKETVDKTSYQSNYKIENTEESKTETINPNYIEEKYRTIFQNYAVAITLVDNKERIISWNKYTEKLLNMNEKDLYLKPVSELYPVEEWQKIRALNVRQKGIKYHMETKIIKKNQGIFDVELSLSVLKSAEGKTVGSVGIIKDISKLKITERRLKESEEKYRTIFENSAIAITLTDEKEQIISWNKFTEDLFDMNKNNLYLKPVESLYPPEEWQKIRSENVRQKGMQHNLETKIIKKNNEILDVNLSLSVLKNYEDKIVGSIGVIADISESKELQRALEKSEKKYQLMYEKAPIPYHTLSLDGIITNVNKRWCQILGYSKKEAIGKSIFDFITEEERESAKSSFMKKIQNKKPYTGRHERKYLVKNGKQKTFVIHDFLSFDEENNVTSVYTTMEDITKSKKAEKEAKEAHEKLEILNKKLEKKVQERTAEIKQLLEQKDDFINQLGHDLKTPLTPLVSLLPILEKTEEDPKSKEILEVLGRNVNYIKNLVIKTIELARLNTDSTVFDIKDLNLWEEAENAVKDQKYRWDEKGLIVENKIDENIFVKADKLRLGELFYNLINNAVKYTTYGGNITVDAFSEGDFVNVLVEDSGVGMNDEQIKHVFNEFYKADYSRHDFGSVGLGLSICKRIVEKHGGKIWVESPGQGKGSTFYFTLKIGNNNSKSK